MTDMKEIYFTYLSAVPVRKAASDESEIVTQLIFGDFVELLEVDRQWRKVKVIEDGYEGWLDHKMITKAGEDKFLNEWRYLQEKLLKVAVKKDGVSFTQNLYYGSRWPVNYSSRVGDKLTLSIEGLYVEAESGAFGEQEVLTGKNMISVAEQYDGVPYLWGGKSFTGIDCSGYVQVVLQRFGVTMPRDAYQQFEYGISIGIEEVAAGDLAYFANDAGKVTHVGFITEEMGIWHAHGRVRKDHLTEEGIVNAETQKLTHKLCGIIRMI